MTFSDLISIANDHMSESFNSVGKYSDSRARAAAELFKLAAYAKTNPANYSLAINGKTYVLIDDNYNMVRLGI